MATEAIAAAIRQHYESLGKVKVEVPEWGMTIWATPLNLAEQAKIDGWRNQNQDRYIMFARIIIMKGQDEAGNKLFSEKDLPLLTTEGYGDTVSRVGRELVRVPEGHFDAPHAEEIEDAKKPSGEASG